MSLPCKLARDKVAARIQILPASRCARAAVRGADEVRRRGPLGKHVLVVHSVGNAAPLFAMHSTPVESELTAKIGERFDLDEVSLRQAKR